MKTKDIKKKILSWVDFYGGEVLQQDELKKCTNKKQCQEIMETYRKFLELQHVDAMMDFDNFVKGLGF